MGCKLSILEHWMGTWEKEKPKKMVVFGTEDCGRSTILWKLRHPDTGIATTPTTSIQMEDIQINCERYVFWDIPDGKYTDHWMSEMASDVDAFIFVVDASAPERFKKAMAVLESWMSIGEIDTTHGSTKAPLLIWATKQDLKQSATKEAMIKGLGLEVYKYRRKWRIQECSGITGDGLDAGMSWIHDTLETNKTTHYKKI